MRISDWSSDVCSSDLLDEYLQCREIAGIGDIEMTVVLGMGIEDGVVFPFFLGLVFPVGVHRQAERILPPVPVVNLDPLIPRIGEYRQIGRAHVRTPVTNAHTVCSLLLSKKTHTKRYSRQHILKS